MPLCGSLRIHGLENVNSKGDAEQALLKQKRNLNKLTLEWTSSTACGSNDLETYEEVLEGLEPHQNLKSLTVKGYQGVRIANWMVRKSFLLSLTLSCCRNIKEINFLPLGLRKLRVECCRELTQLPPFGGTIKVLRLKNCPVLKRLQSMPNNSPSLEVLEVVGCPMLTTKKNSLLVEEVAERGTSNCFSQAESIENASVIEYLLQQEFPVLYILIRVL